MVTELDYGLGVVCLHMKPERRDVVPNVTSWIVAWTKMAAQSRIVSLTVVDSPCLLYVGNIINTISPFEIKQLLNAKLQIQN